MEPATQCSYIGCDKPGRKGRRFHLLPVKNSSLSVKWLINSGREDLLTYESNVLQSMNLAICSDHFHDNDYNQLGNLKENTVPLQYWDLGYSCELGEIKEGDPPNFSNDDSFTTTDTEACRTDSDNDTDNKYRTQLGTRIEALLNSEGSEKDSDIDTDDEFRTQLGHEIEALLNSVQPSHRQIKNKKRQDVGQTLRSFYKKLNLKSDKWKIKNENSDANNFIAFKISTEDTCRTCAKKKKNLVDITAKTNNSDIDIITKLKLLIEIKERDVLPTKICGDCLNKLEQAYKFFQQIYDADNILRDMLIRYKQPGKNIPNQSKQNGHAVRTSNSKTEGISKIIHRNSSNGIDQNIYNINNTEGEKSEVCLSKNTENTVSYLLSGYCNNDADLNWLDVVSVMEKKKVKDKTKLIKTVAKLATSPFQIPCRYCNRSFKLRRQLKTHITVDHLQQTNYMCEYCNICCKSEENLLEHQAQVHFKEKYKCNDCGDKFDKKSELKSHIERIHSTDKNLTEDCRTCDERIAVTDMDSHVASHSDKTYVCNDCDKTFNMKKILRNHIHRLHPPFSYTCTICSKIMHSESDTYKHMSMHDKSPLFPCLDCGRMFYSTEKLDKHKNTHGKNNLKKKKRVWFHCQLCDASYRIAEELINHIETHSSQDWENYRNKILYCGECNARLIGSDKFRVHKMRYHLAKRGDFICLLCDQVTEDIQTLKKYEKHINLHSNELKRAAPRRYKCEHCDKAFKSNSHRINHIDSFHSDVTHSCPICNLKVKRKGNLKDHIDRVHSANKQQSLTDISNCEIKSESASILQKNLITQDEEGPSYKCEHCETVLEHEECRDNHVLNHHINNPKRFKQDISD